jgi:hypothetical protein
MRPILRTGLSAAAALSFPLLLAAQSGHPPGGNVETANGKDQASQRFRADAHGIPVSASDMSPDVRARKPPTREQMLAAMLDAATPGDMHKKLEDMVGTFDADVRMFMDPSKPPEDSKGTSVNTWALGNRFVESKYEGTFMDNPFNGIGYMGYDNTQKRYVGSWMDTASTGMMWSTCAPDSSGKSMKCKSTSVWDPMTGKASPMEFKSTITDHDHYTMEMFGTGPNGQKYKMMEISYTRKS